MPRLAELLFLFFPKTGFGISGNVKTCYPEKVKNTINMSSAVSQESFQGSKRDSDPVLGFLNCTVFSSFL